MGYNIFSSLNHSHLIFTDIIPDRTKKLCMFSHWVYVPFDSSKFLKYKIYETIRQRKTINQLSQRMKIQSCNEHFMNSIQAAGRIWFK